MTRRTARAWVQWETMRIPIIPLFLTLNLSRSGRSWTWSLFYWASWNSRRRQLRIPLPKPARALVIPTGNRPWRQR
jgi:hypothetical protein